MKRKFLLTIICLMAAVPFLAAPVTADKAQQKAKQFLSKNTPRRSGSASITSAELHLDYVGVDNTYYLFNVGQNEGFVIVSGDDATNDILGYSDEGKVDPATMPCNMRAWLNGYTYQIQYVREHPAAARKANRAAHATLRLDESRLARWNQDPPYNSECPMDGNDRSITGCVATALAQLLYYHKSPSATLNKIPAYVTFDHKLEVDAVESNTPINWTNMKLHYTSQENAEAVAKLMKYAGSSVQMDYTSSASGAFTQSAPYALTTYFGYWSKAYCDSHAYYTADEWDDLMYNELKNNGPVLFSGTDPKPEGEEDASHAFLLEGYEDGYFYVNFGWGGYKNGKYLLSLVDGHEDDLIMYNNYQSAVLNVVPGIGDGNYPLRLMSKVMNVHDKSYSRTSKSDPFKSFSFQTSVANFIPLSGLCFDYGIALFKGGVRRSNVLIVGTNETLRCGGSLSMSTSNNFNANSPDGIYRVCNVSRKSGTEEWYKDDYSNHVYSEVAICGNTMVVKQASGSANLKGTSFTIANNATPTIGVSANYDISIANYNGETYTDYLLATLRWTDENGDLQDTPISVINSNLTANHSTTVQLSFTPTFPGEQEIRILDSSWNVVATKTITVDDTPLEIGDTFTANTEEGIEVTYRVTSTSPKTVSIESASGNMWEAAIDEEMTGPLTIPSTVRGYTVTAIGDYAFNYSGITSVSIPSSVTSIGRAAFMGCDALEQINGMDHVVVIKDIAFKGCEKMTSFPLPSTLKMIGIQAFSDCDGLQSFTLPASVTVLEQGGGYSYKLLVDCDNLTSLSVEDGNTVYDSRNNCNAIIVTATNTLYEGCRTTVIPETVVAIGDFAFGFVENMKSIDIPASVMSIGEYAFAQCSDLETVTVGSTTPPAVENSSFTNPGNLTLCVPHGTKSAYEEAEIWNTFGTIVEAEVINDVSPAEAVDLGLSVKWASCNVGADTPEGYGSYFAWAETTPKSTYTWDNYKYKDQTTDNYTKYTYSHSDGTPDGKWYLEKEDDAAAYQWGGTWRIPTNSEFNEMSNACTHEWEEVNGVAGMRYTAPNGNSIFLPAAGVKAGENFSLDGTLGLYWTNERNYYTDDVIYRYIVTPEIDNPYITGMKRYFGFTIRAVKDVKTSEKVKIGSYEWATFSSDEILDLSAVTPSGLKAYIVTGRSGTAILVTQATGKVPANTGLLLQGTPNTTYTIPVAATANMNVTGNLLKPGNGSKVWSESGKTKYALSVTNDKAAFKKITSAATIPYGKAYLEFNEEISDAPLLDIENISTHIDMTGISRQSDGVYYNLSGQRVSQPTKGLYIVNGKKHFVR